MRKIEIELPDVLVINGAADAPEALRNVNTAKWSSEFCLTALIHGISQKLGDTWSVSKKDTEKLKKVHESLVAGNWTTKARTGVSATKFDAAIAALNTDQLYAKLTKEQLMEIAAKVATDNAK